MHIYVLTGQAIYYDVPKALLVVALWVFIHTIGRVNGCMRDVCVHAVVNAWRFAVR